MGASASSAVDSIDTSKEGMREVKASLEDLVALCETRRDLFQAQIRQSLQNPEADLRIPITYVMTDMSEIRVAVSVEENVTEQISSAIQDFVNLNIVSGISKLLTGAVKAVIGTRKGSESTKTFYSCFVQNGAVVRLDAQIWCRAVSADSVLKQQQNCVVVVMTKSIVDCKQLQFTDFVAVYSQLLESSGHTAEICKKHIEDARELYTALSAPIEGSEPQQRGRALVLDDASVPAGVVLNASVEAASKGAPRRLMALEFGEPNAIF